VRLNPLGASGNNWPNMPALGASGGMRIGRGNRITRRNSVPVSLCPSQIPRDAIWDRTRNVEVGKVG
jgi:hypothetical protein